MAYVDARSQTFGVSSSSDLLQKLQWEIQQAARTKYLKESAYVGINLSITAHHVLDWIAVELTEGRGWDRAIDILGLDITAAASDRKKLQALQRYARTESLYMRVAEQIANSSKHRERHAPLFDGGVVTPNVGADVRIVVSSPDPLVGIQGGAISYFGMQMNNWLVKTRQQLGFEPVSSTSNLTTS